MEIDFAFNDELDKMILFLTQKTGITFQQTHRDSVIRFLENRFVQLKLDSTSKKIEYLRSLQLNPYNKIELTMLINASTVNETYFFREEKQFFVLKSEIFPKLKAKDKVNIWSAACSSGEEAISLKLLADYCKLNCKVYATDINTSRLEIIKKGVYRKRSVRQFDGEAFYFLISSFAKNDEIVLPPEIVNQIEVSKNNLADLVSITQATGEVFSPGCYFDVIFIRNVFIYFTIEMRYQILKTLTEKYLADDGYIFVSMNEVAMLEQKYLPQALEKINFGNIFCFHKKIGIADG